MKDLKKNTYIPEPLKSLHLEENEFAIFLVNEKITKKNIFIPEPDRYYAGQEMIRVKMTVIDGSEGIYHGRFAFFATPKLTDALLEHNFLYPGVQYKLERLKYGYRVTNLTNGLTASSCRPKAKGMRRYEEVLIGGINVFDDSE